MTSYQFIIIISVLCGILAGVAMIYNLLSDIFIVLIHERDNSDAREIKE